MSEDYDENKITILKCLEACFLRKLNKNYDESETHVEYDNRKCSLDQSIKTLLNLINKYELGKDCEGTEEILALLLMLMLELKSEGPWQCEKTADVLNGIFKSKYNLDINDLLYESSGFPAHKIFYACIENLHSKLTPRDFKKYPSLLEVYCSIIYKLPEFKLTDVNPLKVLPAALLLIDDFGLHNKKKGLQCCKAVLSCSTWDNFTYGNYYEVIFQSLKKLFTEKDLDITRFVINCMEEFLNLMSKEAKDMKMGELLLLDLDEIYMESNFYRKIMLFEILEKLIVNYQINCVRNKKKIDRIILDNLNICVHREIREVMLLRLLQCLEMWIKYCWPLWKYGSDKKIISALFKILYAADSEEVVSEKVQKMLISLILLCDHQDILKIVDNIGNCIKQIPDGSFSAKLLQIKDFIQNQNTPQLHKEVTDSTSISLEV